MKIYFNGKFYPADVPLLTAQNRSFKWGDGVFETAKVFNGRLLLEDFHFERLTISLQLLQIDCIGDVTRENLLQNILSLCAENNCLRSARIRLAVYRNEDNSAGYLIEAIPLDESVNCWQEQGQTICLYPHVRKSMDAFANVKSVAHLPYILAQKFAQEKKFDDALVLNASGFLCDSSRANIFLIKKNIIYTPALHQGCINGVMRRVVMEEVKRMGYRLHHDKISEEQLLYADEVFLTNAIQIMRWVNQYKNATYSCQKTKEIFYAVSATIFPAPC